MNKFRLHPDSTVSHHVLTHKLPDGSWTATTTTKGVTDKVWVGKSEQDAAQAARSELHQLTLKGDI